MAINYPQYINYNGTLVKIENGKATQVLNNNTPKISVHTNAGLLAIFTDKIGDENHTSDAEQFTEGLNAAIATLQAQNTYE